MAEDMRDYAQVLADLNRHPELSSPQRDWSGSRIAQAAADLQLPPAHLLRVQVVGTNGKGSTAYFIYQLLAAHDWSVGLFTSPHLTDVRERIRTPQGLISPQDFTTCYHSLQPVFQRYALSYFEKLTLLAMYYFTTSQLQCAVLETGLGGRFDAVTTFANPVVVFTPIALDHTAYLGPTLEHITTEKAQVLQHAQQAYTSAQQPMVGQWLRQWARQYECGLTAVSPALQVSLQPDGTSFRWRGHHFKLPMYGMHYANNAVLALTVAHALLGQAFNAALAAQVLAQSCWPARLQILSVGTPAPLILSGAHNEAALQADLPVVKQLLQLKGWSLPRVLLAVSGQRDVARFSTLIEQFFPLTALTCLPGHEAVYQTYKQLGKASPQTLTAPARSDCMFFDDCQQAFAALLRTASTRPLLIIGSLYLCGLLLRYLASRDESC